MRQLLGRLTSPVPSRDDKSGDPGGRPAGSGDRSAGAPGDKPGDPGNRPGNSGDSPGDSGDRIDSGGRARPGRGRSSRKIQAALAGEASAAVADVEYPPPAQDPAAAAFFDVDNTLMRGASIYHFARGLAARKMFRPLDLVRLTWGQLSFRLRGTENSDHIDAVRQSALAFVAGHQVADIVALGEEIYDDTMADRIWAGSRELTRRHLAAGQRVWLVTATPVELANILARRLGLTGALGTVAESVQGVYTGRLVGGLLHGEAKAAAIRALAVREGLDLARCTAYSDSANDLPMLSLVGYPHVVNPDADLLAEARRNGWPVHDFRSGRRVTMIALPAAAGAGAIAGGLAAGVALHRRRARS
jgi:HAD superfamily hydrolase (TIGR01490 family)